MARKKVIKREQILETAFEIVRESGFSKLTARSIASKMGCSTQPIYLEFKNMADLKDEVYERVEQELKGWLIRKEPYHDDPLISICLGYIEFSIVEHSLYRTLSVDDFGSSQSFKTFIEHTFKQVMDENLHYRKLSSSQQEAIASQLWTLTTGIASGITSHLIKNDTQKIIDLLKNYLEYLLSQEIIASLYHDE